MTGHANPGSWRIVMTAGERGGTGSIGVSMDALGMSMTHRSNMAATGSASVTVHGAGLGLVVFTAMGRAGQTGCEGTEWESETAARCMLGQGARGSLRIVMTAGEQGGSGSAVFTVDTGGLSLTRGYNRAATGSVSVTVHGAGLGLTSMTAMGRSGQMGCKGTEWKSETSMRCLMGRGAQGTSRMVMTAGERGESMTRAWSVDDSSVSMLQPGNRGATRSASVTVHGAGLGLMAFTAMGRGGQTGCEGTEWKSDTSLRCSISIGLLGSRRVSLTFGQITGSISTSFSYDLARTSAMQKSNVFGTGSTVMTVHGMVLGISLFSVAIRLAASSCEHTSWKSDSSVLCSWTSGFVQTASVILTMHRARSSVSESVSYDLPQISSATTQDFPMIHRL